MLLPQAREPADQPRRGHRRQDEHEVVGGEQVEHALAALEGGEAPHAEHHFEEPERLPRRAARKEREGDEHDESGIEPPEEGGDPVHIAAEEIALKDDERREIDAPK